jgi:hypothetical protein
MRLFDVFHNEYSYTINSKFFVPHLPTAYPPTKAGRRGIKASSLLLPEIAGAVWEPALRRAYPGYAQY